VQLQRVALVLLVFLQAKAVAVQVLLEMVQMLLAQEVAMVGLAVVAVVLVRVLA
jgi:hypothetical protein